jgi:hypothetical protein
MEDFFLCEYTHALRPSLSPLFRFLNYFLHPRNPVCIAVPYIESFSDTTPAGVPAKLILNHPSGEHEFRGRVKFCFFLLFSSFFSYNSRKKEYNFMRVLTGRAADQPAEQ